MHQVRRRMVAEKMDTKMSTGKLPNSSHSIHTARPKQIVDEWILTQVSSPSQWHGLNFLMSTVQMNITREEWLLLYFMPSIKYRPVIK